MRIVKLSDSEPSFVTLDGVKRFFFGELRERTPPGKFQVTPRHIAQDGLSIGEPLLFTYKARVVFTARAGSELAPNSGIESQQYPNYFLVDLATLREADEDFHDVERWYREASGDSVNLVESRGWSRLSDSIHTNQLWDRLRGATAFTLPEEVVDQAGLVEGATRTIAVNAYERNPEARRRCIEHYGPSCSVCGLNFAAVYGPVAEGFIHVHHLRPLADIRAAYVVDPIKDLRPVCPNCHAVVHRRIPQYSIDEVRDLLRRGA